MHFEVKAGFRLIFVFVVSVLALGFWLMKPAPALAGGTVVNCADEADFASKMAGGGLVTFNCGGVGSPATIPLTSTKTITTATQIDGGGVITFSVNGNISLRFFSINAGAQFIVSNTVMTGGWYTTTGNGVYVFNNGVTQLSNVTLRNGNLLASGATGGAIYNGGVITLTSSALITNAINGGGASGAGMFNNGSAWLINSTVSGNTSGNGNGAGVNNSGTLVVINSTLSGNSTAGNGAGLYNAGTLTLTNSTLSGNNALNSLGGGIYNAGNISITNGTIVSNVARSGTNNGGGLFNAGSAASVTVLNTILANNSGASGNEDCSGGLTSQGYNISNKNSCPFTTTGDVKNVTVALGVLQNNGGSTLTHKPTPGSAPVDAGACVLPTDQRGQTRPASSTLFCDSGAVELENVTADLSISKTGTPLNALPSRTVTYTILFSNTGSGKSGNVVITDVVPAELTSINTQASIAAGYLITQVASGPANYVWNTSDLRPGIGGQITITAIVSPALAANVTITNVVSITGTGEITPQNNAAASPITVMLAPNIKLIKTATPTFALPGQTVTFSMQLLNDGFATASGIVLTDAISNKLTALTAQASVPITSISGAPFVWQISNLPVNASAFVTVTGVVSPNLLGDVHFVNTATVFSAADIFPADDISVAYVGASSCFARVFDGVSDGPIMLTVQDAMNAALSGQLVKVAGYCTGSANFGAGFTVRGGYTLTNWATPDATTNPATLDAIKLGRVVNTNSGYQITLEDMIFTSGSVSGADGAGILNTASTVTLTRVTVRNNMAQNFFSDGAGIANSGSMRIDSSIVASNVLSNSSSGRGGGIANFGTLEIVNSAIITNSNSNSSNLGGGIWNTAGLFITNTTISGNAANGFAHHGGGIASISGTVSLLNDTISNNSVSGFNSDAGGVYQSGGVFSLHNTIIANSGGGNCGGSLSSVGYNLSSDATCALAATGDLTNTLAVLGPLANNGGNTPSHLPLAGSPAKNNGDNAGCPSTDQRGQPRPYGGQCDIGSLEVGVMIRAFVPNVMRSTAAGW